ncbi:MAG: DUF3306 domain-containing protein [Casimicrobium sp.]
MLSRWSRLKRGQPNQKDSISKDNENELITQDNWAINESSGSDVSVPLNASSEQKVALNDDALPSLTDIALDRDFTPFMQAKVPEALKRQALKALFKDAHFNTMDGLDTYIDDYTKFDPISAEEMAGLSSWKSIMKPLEQVVTPGGYAVDVESEEGRAVLAAREALAKNAENGIENVNASSPEDPLIEQAMNPIAEETSTVSLPHERYGKRVGDFKSDYAPLHVEEAAAIAPPISSSAKQFTDDPR